MLVNIILFLLAAIAAIIYAYRGVSLFASKIKNNKYKRNINKYYRITDVLFVMFALLWIIINRSSDSPDYVKYRNFLYITGAFALIYFPKFSLVPFILINDFNIFLYHLMRRLNSKAAGFFRKSYESNIVLSFGVIVALSVFLIVAYGIVVGKSNYKVNEVDLYFDDLPETFNDFKMVHISDAHLGSFKNQNHILRAIEIIDGLDSDVILFAGDLINNEAAEGIPYIDYFRKLEAESGMFSVLGNHDIGDYRRWYMIEEREPCIASVEKLHKDFGFKLLRDNHAFIHKGMDSIMIAGVDNWGLPPFEKTGDLHEALYPYNDFEFIILLSHDPTHWEEEVLEYENIRLTLSGHTHGMQFGINIGNFKWSPAKYVYKYWHGLYSENNQFLYVNSGLGVVGIPLRAGMPPEITIITIKKR